MPTLLQYVVRTTLIAAFTIVASVYSILRLLVWHWRAYRKQPADECIYDLFKSKLYKRPGVLDEGWNHGFLHLSEIRMHYVQSSDDTSKPLMVCLHGFPQFWYSFRFQLRHFANDYRVVALDMRGYGESDKPLGVHNYEADSVAKDVAEAIEKLGGSAILLGHDWGGVIAWYVAIKRPELVNRLVIMNAPHPKAYLKIVRTNARQLWKSWYIFLFQCPLLGEYFMSALDFYFPKSAFYSKEAGLSNSRNITKDDFQAWKYTFSQSNAFTPPLNYYRAAARSAGGLQFTAELVRPRTLVIWGVRDVALEPQIADLSVTYCQNARVEKIPNASHWVQEDAPELVNRLIQTFLEEETY